jgi:hypothetical protein
MIGWLDALGWFKWPSLALIAAPLIAYPSWAPDQQPAPDCGLVELNGTLFRAYKGAEEGEFILRPTTIGGTPRITFNPTKPTGFDSGGMIVNLADRGHISRCSSSGKPSTG